MQTKEMMLNLVKEQILLWGNKLDQSNINEVTEAIQSQLKLLDSLREAIFLSEDNRIYENSASGGEEDSHEENESTITSPSVNSDELNREDELVSVADEVSIEKPVKSPEAKLEKEKRVPEKLHEENIENGLVVRGYFTQKVRGGIVHKKQQVFVPESIARKLNLKTGDFVECTRYGFKGSRPQHNFEIIQRAEKTPPKEREEISCLVIKYHEDLKRLYIELDDPKQEFPIPILISDADIAQYHLQEGDIVTYAHEIGNVQKGCVIWRHPIEDAITKENTKTSTSKEIKHKAVKKKTVKKRRYLPIFEGINILMIGGTNRGLHKTIQPEVESRSGNFRYLSGDEKETTMKARIKKADLVIVFTESISHHAMWQAKSYIKQFHKMHSFTKNMGPEAFVRRASILKKKMLEKEVISV